MVVSGLKKLFETKKEAFSNFYGCAAELSDSEPDDTPATAAAAKKRKSRDSDSDFAVEADDYLYVITPQEHAHLVDQMLVPLDEAEEHEQAAYFGDFTLNGDARMVEIARAYGASVPPLAKDLTLAEFLAHRFHERCVIGDRVLLGPMELVVREMDGNIVSKVGVRILRR